MLSRIYESINTLKNSLKLLFSVVSIKGVFVKWNLIILQRQNLKTNARYGDII